MSAGAQASGGSGTRSVRPLVEADLEAVVALDRRITGRSRRGYFEKRLAAALRDPSGHIQVAVTDDGALAGFALARVLEGEFGRERSAVALETIDVEPGHRRRGLGRMLLAGLEKVMRHKGIRELQTQAAWSDHDLLRFFDATGFSLALRQVVGCPVGRATNL